LIDLFVIKSQINMTIIAFVIVIAR